MCMSVIHKRYELTNEERWGWKAFLQYRDRPLVGMCQGNVVHEGVWLTAGGGELETTPQFARLPDIPPVESYPNGFHFYVRREDAEAVWGRIPTHLGESVVILRVKARGVLVSGLNDRHEAFIAREMYVPCEGEETEA